MPEIAVASWPRSSDEFGAMVAAGKPLVFRGVAADWPCTRLWTTSYLKERLAQKTVTVTRSSSAMYRADPERGHYAADQMEPMPFGEFLDRICAPDHGADGTHYYLHKHSLEHHVSELQADIVVPEYIHGSPFLLKSLWMGPRGSVTPIHHDFTDNLFVQVRGRKRVILYDPEPDAAFYRLPFRSVNGRSSWHISRVGSLEGADLSAFPLFREAQPVEIIAEPGDVLFIPNFYWHEVHSLDSPSMSLSYWWDERTLPEIEATIAKITEFVQLHDGLPLAWRSLLRRLVRDRNAPQ